MTHTRNWEERFDEQFIHFPSHPEDMDFPDPNDIKLFIASVEDAARQEGREEAVNEIEARCPQIAALDSRDGKLHIELETMPEGSFFLLLTDKIIETARAARTPSTYQREGGNK